MPHRRAPRAVAPSTADIRTITVDTIRKFGGVYEVVWRDDGKKRKILVAIEQWSMADQTVRDAVSDSYPVEQRPVVAVPMNAWR